MRETWKIFPAKGWWFPMTLTNTKTILRQIGANGGSGWGLPDDSVSEEEVAISMHGKRVLKVWMML